jgi:glycosyltransferase involved in cell wall biosynthesis
MTISVVLPCYNEEKNIAATVRDVADWMRAHSLQGEIIVVNDGSTDGTASVLASLESTHKNLRIIAYSPNRGYGSAVRTGCDSAVSDVIAFMDSDGQFHAKDFDLLLPHLDSVAFVTGRRRKRADPFMRKLNAKLFGFLNLLILGIWVRDINCAMKVFRRSIWKKIRPTHATGALVNAEIFLNLKRKGIVWKQVDVSHYRRAHGTQTGAKLSVIVRMFRELFSLRTSL